MGNHSVARDNLQILTGGLVSQLASWGNRPAVTAEGETKTYSQLAADVAAASHVWEASCAPASRIGILDQRSYLSIVAILASVSAGMTYVPLNPKFPSARLQKVVALSECQLICAGNDHAALAKEITNPSDCRTFTGLHQATHADVSVQEPSITHTAPELTAYIMFTSGTTGEPKGVPITRRNLASYLTAIAEVAPLQDTDKCSHFFDLSFDLSVHDIFHTLLSGACLCIPSEMEMIDPVGFAARSALSVWFSVPSVVAFAHRMRRTKPEALPNLRLALFCGEALPQTSAEVWHSVAPKAKIINLYGPTEATIAITFHELGEPSAEAVAPIGRPLPGSKVAVCDSGLHPVAPGDIGEILLGGGQVAQGYLNNPAQTAAKFVALPHQPGDLWYRTGDLGKQDGKGVLHFQGRVDEQIKINGYRVELLEVEAVLRRVSGVEDLAVVVTKDKRSGVDVLTGFLCRNDIDFEALLNACRELLPSYACPKNIIAIEKIPLNANGKIDRKVLAAMAS